MVTTLVDTTLEHGLRAAIARHPNKRQPTSYVETLAGAIRRFGWHRLDRRELELAIERPLTVLERRAFNIAMDSTSLKNDTKAGHAGRYAAIRLHGSMRIYRGKSGRYRMRGTAERSLDLITDQAAAIEPTRFDDLGTKFPEANFDEPAIDPIPAHSFSPRPDMNVPMTRSAIGQRYRTRPGKLPQAITERVIGQSRYDGIPRHSARPAIAGELEAAVARYLASGGTVERIPAGMTAAKRAKSTQAA